MRVRLIICLLGLLYLPSGFGLTLSGFTAFDKVIDLNARTSGVVKSIPVRTGQRVNQGDVLLELDPLPYEAALERARAVEQSLIPVFETNQLELTRAQELYDRDSLSQVELKNAEYKLAVAEGNLKAANADVQLAQYNLSQTVVHSPVTGRVAQLNANVGKYVDPAVEQSSLVSIVETRRMKAVALVNSDQWNPKLVNKAATIRYREHRFNGVVSFLGFNRIKQPSGLPAYEVYVFFETGMMIPAEMPVTIEIKD